MPQSTPNALPAEVQQQVQEMSQALIDLVNLSLSRTDKNHVDISAIDLSYFTFDVLEYLAWAGIFADRGTYNHGNPYNDVRFLYEMSQTDNITRAQEIKLRGILRDQIYSRFNQWWQNCKMTNTPLVNPTFFLQGPDHPARAEIRKYLNGYDPNYAGKYITQW